MMYKIFPLVVAITNATSPASNFSISVGGMQPTNPGLEMFKYFWEDLGGFLWNEEQFECLLKLICRRELTDLVQLIFRSRTTHAIFEAMSFQYKYSFIEHILSIRNDMLEDIASTAGDDSEVDHDEHEEFVYERKMALKHFFEKVYDQLS